jgi:hypothetical protein
MRHQRLSMMPSGNLEYPPGNRTDHGIAGARGSLPKSSVTAAELTLPY